MSGLSEGAGSTPVKGNVFARFISNLPAYVALLQLVTEAGLEINLFIRLLTHGFHVCMARAYKTLGAWLVAVVQ